ncbi:MAG: 50S ribosomal protein L22 [Candidatus Pacebacteria bacterium]|jgi:large subunit ribosomal protein L22|nr:50S ribosomal protein L22 [Candidatus Paceibacterota bacterium]
MKAVLANYRQSPRKVRLVAGLIKGKQTSSADAELSFLAKRAAEPIRKLLASAIANAKQNFSVKEELLYVKDVRVDKGVTMKRSQPRSHGMATRINKRASHVLIELEERAPKEKSRSVSASKKVSKKLEEPTSEK